jgi:hypothetical protein
MKLAARTNERALRLVGVGLAVCALAAPTAQARFVDGDAHATQAPAATDTAHPGTDARHASLLDRTHRAAEPAQVVTTRGLVPFRGAHLVPDGTSTEISWADAGVGIGIGFGAAMLLAAGLAAGSRRRAALPA